MQGLTRPASRRSIAWENVPSEVRASFHDAAVRMETLLTPASQRAWARLGRELAQRGPDPREAALAYLHASPALAAALDSRRFLRWARLGCQIAGESDRAAAAFYQASPSTISTLAPAYLGAWAGMGLLLCRAAPGGDLVALRFFEASPRLLRHGPPHALGLLAHMLQHVDPRAHDLHLDLLNLAVRLFAAVPGQDLTAFLTGGERVARAHSALLRPYLEAGLSLYARLTTADRRRYRRVVAHLLQSTPGGLSCFLTEGGGVRGLGPLLEGHGIAPLELLARLAEASTAAAREFVRNAATVADRLTTAQMDAWGRLGETQLALRESSGISFFQLQSREALDALSALTPAVDLSEVRGLLQLYCQALMGRTVAIVASEQVTGSGAAAHRATADELDWEGAAIFCPSRMHDFPTKEGNFAAYKVLATHQAGHLEFGTVDFRFAANGQVLTPVRQTLARLQGKERPYYTEFDQYFDLFADRQLARELFTIAEDTRVDQRVRAEYRGIRQAFLRVQAQALAARPDYRPLPLRQQIVELLVRMSLEAASVVDVPEALASAVTQAAGLVNLLAGGRATVEDAAEAAVRLYAVLGQVPNVAPGVYRDQPWVTLDLAAAQYDAGAEDRDQICAAVMRANQEFARRPRDYTPVPPVSFRGDVAPELHQALQKIRRQTRQLAQWQQQESGEGLGSLDDLSDAELLDLVEDYLGISEMFDDLGDMSDGGMRTGRFANREEVLRFLRGQREIVRGIAHENPHIGEEEVQIALYDEWDYRARTYRPKWCRVRQRRLPEGGGAFYDDTLTTYRWLVYAVRNQFEMLRPENQGRIKRLQDGEEIDLDAVVDAHAQRRAGHTPSDKVYMRRHKIDRSVAVALLVDLSVSTRELIEGDAPRPESAADGNAAARSAPKRIIDLERESIVLFIEALEQIGDTYGIYGFSGSGRDDVQFYTIKDLQEVFSDRVRRRVDNMQALQGTRMGPAIRHAVAKLERTEARTKVLILLSDGRPQDRDYGALPFQPEALPRSFQGYDDYGLGSIAHQALMLDEKEYAIHDTKQALNEARAKGITPFCISVDKLGRDYLRAMCGDIGYEVVDEIQSLPRKLPALYRRLTT